MGDGFLSRLTDVVSIKLGCGSMAGRTQAAPLSMNSKQSSTAYSISPADIEQVTLLLGREPRGLSGIPVRDREGQPVVIQVASLVAGKPFPTLFWLVDKPLNYAIDQLEAGGFIARLQAQIDADPQLQAAMKLDHQAHIHLRDSFINKEQQAEIEALGFADVLAKRGIGGIENFQRIRCLHTYYASHLVTANTVGSLLDAYWQAQGVSFSHLQ